MKAYSVDFRQKIIEVYENEVVSMRQLASRFRVALSFVTKLIKQHRTSGHLDPGKSTGRPPILQSSDLLVLKTLLEEHNDWTLAEYQQELQSRLGITVSLSTIDRAIKKLGFTFKKKRFTQQKKEQTGYRDYDWSTEKKSERLTQRT